MTSRDFMYWLQGYFELHTNRPMREEPHDDMALSGYQVEMIRKHLALVFKHEIDPSMGDDKHQAILNTIHQSGKPESSSEINFGLPSKDNDYLIRC